MPIPPNTDMNRRIVAKAWFRESTFSTLGGTRIGDRIVANNIAINKGREEERRNTPNTIIDVLAQLRRFRSPTPDATPQIANAKRDIRVEYCGYFIEDWKVCGSKESTTSNDAAGTSAAPLQRNTITAEIVIPTERFMIRSATSGREYTTDGGSAQEDRPNS